ncbi:MAG TPA: hypothetical protein VIS09_22605 [Streptomyces sp.]
MNRADEQPPGTPAAILREEAGLPTAAERAQVAAQQLQAIFDAYPRVAVITVYVEDSRIGAATRDDYPPEENEAADHDDDAAWSRSDGDRSILPGTSRHYRAFVYSCARCPRAVYSPAPTPPACPVCGDRTSKDS